MLVRVMRMIKKRVVPAGMRYRRIRYGIASGYRLPIDRQNNFRLELGIYEWQLNREMRKFCKGANVAYDIGSAQGYYVLAFCKLIGSTGRVYAFEADNDLAEELKKTLRINKLQDQVRIIKAYISNVDEGETLSIDEVTSNKSFPMPDIVKIDVEGAELKVLQGMEKVLVNASPRIILEVHSQELENECLKLLTRHGYQVRIIEPGRLGKFLPEYRPAAHNQWVVAEK